MLANPRKMIDAGYLQNIKDPARQIQPNAVDWTCDRISRVLVNGKEIIITESTKSFNALEEVKEDDRGLLILPANTQFDVHSDMYVSVPAGYVALLILRSTFVRNGAVLAHGLYDSGFQGHVGCVFHTGNTPIAIERGTRMGQIMFVASDSEGLYAGGYNTKDGVHWKELYDKK